MKIFFKNLLNKRIEFFVEICYNLNKVIPLVTLNKISIPNTPFERIVPSERMKGSSRAFFFMYFYAIISYTKECEGDK